MADLSILREVLRLAEQGIPVFPCNERKRPLVATGFKSATTDPQQIEAWWRQWPSALIGVPTGAVSGFWVVDLDRKPGVDGWASLADLEVIHGKLPETRTVITPSGGYHLYFRYPGHVIKTNAGQLGLGIDLRGDGGYVIAPPSNGYEFEEGETQTIAEAPAWLLGMARGQDERQEAPETAQEAPAQAERDKVDPGALVAAILAGSPLHDSLRDLAAHLRSVGVPELSAIGILQSLMTRSDAMRSRNLEWQERFHDIPRLVRSAEKYTPDDPLADAAEVPSREALVISEGEMASASLTPRCIVENHTYADVAQVVAPGGTGKTTMMLHELIHIVLGRPLWGLDVSAPGWCLIVTAEDQRERLVARLREIMAALHLNMEDRGRVMRGMAIWDVSGERMALTRSHDGNIVLTGLADAIVDRFKDKPPAVVLFDPLVSFGVSEERVNTNEQALITAARRIVKGLDCCVRYIHHTGQANAREKSLDQYSGRGGSALADGSRMTTVLQAWEPSSKLTPPEGMDLDEDSALIVMARAKLSYSPPNLPLIWIKREGYAFTWSWDEQVTERQKDERNAETLLKFLRDELARGNYHTKNTLRDLTRLLPGVTKSRLPGLVAVLLNEGRLVERALPDHLRRGSKQTYLDPVVVTGKFRSGRDE